MRPIRKLLIANRGEIACRVMSTARKMGIRTVAIYSDADEAAMHTQSADEAVRIGPAPVTDSYLSVPAILDAAKATGADAIHPGYGFLSENPAFVDAIAAAGLTFVGPPASAIRAMGLKDAAKAEMEKAGVPVVPGYHGTAQDLDTLARAAEEVGYPVLIKARAGGGGKGMRLVDRAEDFEAALAGAQREGQSSFGDPGVLIEKYIATPRHIEIQIIADAHGNVVHLFERDCSLQRRHQKVIEEAPAPDMPSEVRAAMGKAAVEAARAIGYVGAGTVEFIADGSGPLRPDGFWFMEMNTRLQVEHPVTEAITGLDLVELQLRIAMGDPLPFTQDAIDIEGHAFEARIYAEDVDAGFLPATGHIKHLSMPDGVQFRRGPVRIDAGIRAGEDVTPYYDPMLAKLIVHGPSREEALAQLSRALEQVHIAGLQTNTRFLGRLARHAEFVGGHIDTDLIARNLEDLTAPASRTTRHIASVAAAVTALDLARAQSDEPWDALCGWRAWGQAEHDIVLYHESAAIRVRATLAASHMDIGIIDADGATSLEAVRVRRDADQVTLTVEGRQVRCNLHDAQQRITVFVDGETLAFDIPDPLATANTSEASVNEVLSLMPGMVTSISVIAGQNVEKGQALMVLEAMKMEHTLTAPRDGTVAEVLAIANAQVDNGAVLIRLDPQSDD